MRRPSVGMLKFSETEDEVRSREFPVVVDRLAAAVEELEWLRASIATSGFEVVEVVDTAGRRVPGVLVPRRCG